MNGVLVIDKPAGMTSHDVVYRVRKIVGERSVGHLGTLDPMATGVLPLVLGNMTRLAQFYLKSDKRYEGTIRFGFATDTYDAEGEPAGTPQPVNVTVDRLREMAKRFTGQIQQTPPPFSAKKIGGVPAYKLARKNKEVTLEPVEVEVKELVIVTLTGKDAAFRAHVSSGTYLRSIAHDLGQVLGIGAHLASLRRVSVAEFGLGQAHTLEKLQESATAGTAELAALFVHPREILPAMPAVTADEETAARIRHGMAVNLPETSCAGLVKVFAGQRELIAIVARVAGTLFQPKIVLVGNP
ncbi:MAG: tRNA pseudouridine(55) synthase TruB [Acidobacteriota bacterium]|nr:tRNA pseudouridine(55) synthase TruB [Acidobacteriota bacterium]